MIVFILGQFAGTGSPMSSLNKHEDDNMIETKINEAYFSIPSVANSSTGTGSVTLPYGPSGMLVGIRVSAAGSSTDFDLYLGDGTGTLTEGSIDIFHSITGLKSGTTYLDDTCMSWFTLDNKLQYLVKNNDGSHATGAITVKIIFDNDISELQIGEIS